jgi:hypothetical protein
MFRFFYSKYTLLLILQWRWKFRGILMKSDVLIVIFFTMVAIVAHAENISQPQPSVKRRAQEVAGESQHMDPRLKKKVAELRELGTDLDVAESSLRVLMNEPVKGTKFSDKEISCENQLKAAMALMNFEMRHSGYLQGKHGDLNWPQYQGVRELFNKLPNKYEFFSNSSEQTAPSSSNGNR